MTVLVYVENKKK